MLKTSTFGASFSDRKFAEARIHEKQANGTMSEVLPDRNCFGRADLALPCCLHALRVFNVAESGESGKHGMLVSKIQSMLVGGKQCIAEACSRVSGRSCGAQAWECREGALADSHAVAVLRGTLRDILHSGLVQWRLLLRSDLRIFFHNCLLQWLFVLLFLSLLRSRRSWWSGILSGLSG